MESAGLSGSRDDGSRRGKTVNLRRLLCIGLMLASQMSMVRGAPTRPLLVLEMEGDLPKTRLFLEDLVEHFAAHRGFQVRWIRGRTGVDPGPGDPAVLLRRRVDPQDRETVGNSRRTIQLPLLPVRDVFLENKKNRLRNENQIFSGVVHLVDEPGVRRLVGALEARYGQSLDVRWTSTLSEAIAQLRAGKSAWTVCDSDVALTAAHEDPDLQVNWRFLDPVAPVKSLCLTAFETTDERLEARGLSIAWCQWWGDGKDGPQAKVFPRHTGLPYFTYLQSGGSNLRQWDGEMERRRVQAMLGEYETRLTRRHPGNLAEWGPLALEYFSSAGPYEIQLDELDWLASNRSPDRGDWLRQIERRAPQVWERWMGLRGGETNWTVIRPGGLPFIDQFWSKEDKKGLARDYLRGQAEKALKAHSYEDAVKLLERLSRDGGEDPAVERLLHEARTRREQVNTEVRRRQTVATFREAARLAESRGDLEGARVSWIGVQDLLPDDLEARKGLENVQNLIKERDRREELGRLKAMLDEAIQHYQAGRYEPAVALLESCLTLAPGNHQVQEYLDLSMGALDQLGSDHGDPRSPYQDLVLEWTRDARAAEAAGESAVAERQWLRILNLFPGHLEAGMGRLRARERLNPGTLKAWADAQWQEVQNLKKNQQTARAQALADRIRLLVPSAPGPVPVGTNGGGDGTKRALPVDPAWVAARYEEGLKAYAKDDWIRAQKIYQEILERDPQQNQARLFLDRIRTRQAFAEGSTRAPASGAREDLIEKLHQRALDLYNQGRADEAVSEWERILQLDPTDRKAQNSLRRVKTLKGKG